MVTVAQDTDLASRGNKYQRADVTGFLFKYPSLEISKKAKAQGGDQGFALPPESDSRSSGQMLNPQCLVAPS